MYRYEYMYASIIVSQRICVWIHTCVRLHIKCCYVYMYANIIALQCICVWTYICIHVYIAIHICKHICIATYCGRVCITAANTKHTKYAHTHTHTHTCTHTYTYTHTHNTHSLTLSHTLPHTHLIHGREEFRIHKILAKRMAKRMILCFLVIVVLIQVELWL